MGKQLITLCLSMVFFYYGFSQSEPFSVRTVNTSYKLNSAWELTYGPDDSLWVTENVSYLVSKISPATGGKTTILDLTSKRGFTATQNPWPQGGLMGMALHPTMYTQWPNPSKPYVYLAYVYQFVGYYKTKKGTQDSGAFFKTRIARYEYQRSTKKLINGVTIIENLNGSSDHNSGRLAIGNVGGTPYLFYTIGDMGTGQFKNLNRNNRAQVRDTLEGKIMRFNLEAIGPESDPHSWIPTDNPFQDANGKATPVWSYGHRNAQGLAFASDGTLYSSEQQDMSDDEVNLIEKGRNYGWPLVSGFSDGNYDGYKLANMPVVSEKADSALYNLHEPMYTLYTTPNPSSYDGTSNSTWPTVACSSIDVYENYIIPNWNRSLLVPSLKAGKVQRLKLDATGKKVVSITDINVMNLYNHARLRDLCITPDGMKIYVACDQGSQDAAYQGKILEYTYTGPLGVLSIKPDSLIRITQNKDIQVYPNPASKVLNVKMVKSAVKPVYYALYDMNGKLTNWGTSNSDAFTVNIEALAPGVYILKLYNAYNIDLGTRKVVVK